MKFLNDITEGFSGHVSVVRGKPLVAAEKKVPMVVKLYWAKKITLG